MSSLTSGSSGPERSLGAWRYLLVAAIDSVGLVALPFGGWAVLLVGAALMVQSPATQSTPVQSTQNNGGTFCYSGGQCYINGVPVSGHP